MATPDGVRVTLLAGGTGGAKLAHGFAIGRFPVTNAEFTSVGCATILVPLPAEKPNGAASVHVPPSLVEK